jgi:biopolymer transport protein TolR
MRRRLSEEPVSDINITPLTDVMLVLLIIFMISSPVLLSRGMEVHLPQVDEPPMLIEEDHVLYINADGTIVLDGENLTSETLLAEFQGLVSSADETGDSVNLFIRGDEAVRYGDITHIMDIATTAGIEQISLVQDVNHDSDEPVE